jgi:hypothetical protein
MMGDSDRKRLGEEVGDVAKAADEDDTKVSWRTRS